MGSKICLFSVVLLSGVSAFAVTPTCPNIQAALSDFTEAQSYLGQAAAGTPNLANEKVIVAQVIYQIEEAISYKGCQGAAVPPDAAQVFVTSAFSKCPLQAMAMDIAESGRHRLDVASEDYNGYRQQADTNATNFILMIQGDLWKNSACQ